MHLFSKADGPLRRQALTWLMIAGLAFGLRFLAAWITGAFSHPQLHEYDEIARSLLAGRGLTYIFHGIPYHSYEAPLYPWICAGVYALTGGSTSALLVVQMVAGAATAVLVAVIGERLFNRSAGMAGGLLVACHPGLIVFASLKAHALTFDALCFSIVLWQFLELQHERTLRRSLWTGLALGVAILERPTAIAFLPAGLVWLMLTVPRGRRMAEFTRGLLISACALLVISPWLIRNALIHHQFVFIRSTNWEVFWRGNNPHATGHSYIDADHTVLETLPSAALAELERLPEEHQQARWFRDQAFAFIHEHPGAFIRLTLTKLYQFWWFAPQTGVLYPSLWLHSYQAFYLVVVCLALVGVRHLVGAGTARQRHAVRLMGLMLLGVSLVQSLHYVEGRHRWAVEPFILLLAGFQLMRTRQALWERVVPGGR